MAVLAEGALKLSVAAKLPGMPSASAFCGRRKNDPAFAARVASFYKPQAARQAAASAQLDWEGALARIRSGEPFEAFKGMGAYPTHDAWYNRRRRDPAFNQSVLNAIEAGEVRSTGSGRVRAATRSEILLRLERGDNLRQISALPGMPTVATIWRLRKKSPSFSRSFDASYVRPASGRFLYTPADYDRVIGAVQSGHSVNSLRALGLPGGDAIRNWRKRNPDFERRLSMVTGWRGNVRTEVNQLQAALSQNEIWAAVNAAVSRGLYSFVRDDVVSEMVADVIEGHLAAEDIRAAAREYVAEHFRQAGTHRTRSLDADVYGDSGRTLHDLLAS